MKDIGFNARASDSVKEAFIKHLIKHSTGNNVQTPTEKKIILENPDKFISFNKAEKYALPTQLAFSFDDEQIVKKKKNAV